MVLLKATDCVSMQEKVSFVSAVNGFPSGLPMNDVPCSRKTAGGCEIGIKV